MMLHKKILSLLLPLMAVGCASAPTPGAAPPPQEEPEAQSQEPDCALLYERLHRDAQSGPDMNFWGEPVYALHDGSMAQSVASVIVSHRFKLRDALRPGAPDFPDHVETLGGPYHPMARQARGSFQVSGRVDLTGLPFLLYLEASAEGPRVARYVPVMELAEARALDALIRSGQCMPWTLERPAAQP